MRGDPRDPDSIVPARRLGAHVCPDLRTKTMYLNEEARGDADDSFGGRSHAFWCLKTMEAVGPDDRPIGPTLCGRDRACCGLPPEV
jgi:hypothetical protein